MNFKQTPWWPCRVISARFIILLVPSSSFYHDISDYENVHESRVSNSTNELFFFLLSFCLFNSIPFYTYKILL